MPFKDKDKARAYAKEYAKKNRDRINENAKKPSRKEKRKKYLERYNADPSKVAIIARSKEDYYLRNKIKLNNQCKQIRKKHQLLLDAVKKFYGCMNPSCSWIGQYDDEILEFHHVDPDKKRSSVSSLLHYPSNAIAEEINKCILLCCNCHRLAHKGKIVITELCCVDDDLKIKELKNVDLESCG